MTSFDAEQVRTRYSALDSEELAKIAFVEESYLPEAKAIAEQLLAERGEVDQKAELIRLVRQEIEEEKYPGPTKGQQSLEKFESVVMVGILWIAAAIWPGLVFSSGESSNWPTLLVIGACWLFFAYFSTRDAINGKPKNFKRIVVIPSVLAAISSVIYFTGP